MIRDQFRPDFVRPGHGFAEALRRYSAASTSRAAVMNFARAMNIEESCSHSSTYRSTSLGETLGSGVCATRLRNFCSSLNNLRSSGATAGKARNAFTNGTYFPESGPRVARSGSDAASRSLAACSTSFHASITTPVGFAASAPASSAGEGTLESIGACGSIPEATDEATWSPVWNSALTPPPSSDLILLIARSMACRSGQTIARTVSGHAQASNTLLTNPKNSLQPLSAMTSPLIDFGLES